MKGEKKHNYPIIYGFQVSVPMSCSPK